MSIDLSTPLVYLITPGDATPENFALKQSEILAIVARAVEAGVALVQIREKGLPARLLLDLAVGGRRLTRDSETKLLVNDRIDVALASGADGVHLPANSPPLSAIRSSFPAGLVIGKSTHSVAEAVSAAEDGADFIVFGPVFRTPGKGDAVGIELLRDVCGELRSFPVIALGGVDQSNMKSVLDAGAAGFAAIRALNDRTTLVEIMEELR